MVIVCACECWIVRLPDSMYICRQEKSLTTYKHVLCYQILKNVPWGVQQQCRVNWVVLQSSIRAVTLRHLLRSCVSSWRLVPKLTWLSCHTWIVSKTTQYLTQLYDKWFIRKRWWLVGWLVGALSPVNHKGLHQGWTQKDGVIFKQKTKKSTSNGLACALVQLAHFASLNGFPSRAPWGHEG